jgi:beta-N-acetylhexosaminidase
MVAELSAAMVAGLQAAGVAATAKHFPGHGDTASDSHHGVPLLSHSLERLREVELPSFTACIRAGVRLVMSGHLALPALDGRSDLPATLSEAVLQGLLRKELGFDGVIVTDALDMGAIRQGEGLGEQAVRAAAAGADLLLLSSVMEDQQRVHSSLIKSLHEGRLDASAVRASADRVLSLKEWLSGRGAVPDLSVVGCAAHRAIADEIARDSITLVRDQAGLLPLRLASGGRLAVVLPRPIDLTPADTSSYVAPVLAQALRQFHPDVDEFIVPHAPQPADIAALLPQVTSRDLVVIGTINAYTQPAQAELVRAILGSGVPTVIAALRMPYDLAAFPEAPTYLCCYSILEPSLRALARALFGLTGCPGKLPASIPGLYPAGSSSPCSPS